MFLNRFTQYEGTSNNWQPLGTLKKDRELDFIRGKMFNIIHLEDKALVVLWQNNNIRMPHKIG